MGKLNVFEIVYSKENAAYISGSLLEGQVVVELTEPMRMKGIKLRVEGKAFVFWQIGKTRYRSTELYLAHELTLLGYIQNQDLLELGVGRHLFPFKFPLPAEIPSSFECDIANGYVRYFCKCSIDEPWKLDHTTKRPFSVIRMLNLNLLPVCNAGQVQSKEKNLCCWCCTSGPIEATFGIDRSGYVPGEAIKLSAGIHNGSNRRMGRSYVNLRMKITFHCKSYSTSFFKEVARVTRPPIEANGDDVWSSEELVIPPVPPSFLLGCRIIDIAYILQLNVDPKGPSLDLEIPLSIVIGTFPLLSVFLRQLFLRNPIMVQPTDHRRTQDSASSSQMAADAEQAHMAADAEQAHMAADTDQAVMASVPPPTYSECVATGPVSIKESDDNKNTRGKLEYTPVYMSYNLRNTPRPNPS